MAVQHEPGPEPPWRPAKHRCAESRQCGTAGQCPQHRPAIAQCDQRDGHEQGELRLVAQQAEHRAAGQGGAMAQAEPAEQQRQGEEGVLARDGAHRCRRRERERRPGRAAPQGPQPDAGGGARGGEGQRLEQRAGQRERQPRERQQHQKEGRRIKPRMQRQRARQMSGEIEVDPRGQRHRIGEQIGRSRQPGARGLEIDHPVDPGSVVARADRPVGAEAGRQTHRPAVDPEQRRRDGQPCRLAANGRPHFSETGR